MSLSTTQNVKHRVLSDYLWAHTCGITPGFDVKTSTWNGTPTGRSLHCNVIRNGFTFAIRWSSSTMKRQRHKQRSSGESRLRTGHSKNLGSVPFGSSSRRAVWLGARSSLADCSVATEDFSLVEKQPSLHHTLKLYGNRKQTVKEH